MSVKKSFVVTLTVFTLLIACLGGWLFAALNGWTPYWSLARHGVCTSGQVISVRNQDRGKWVVVAYMACGERHNKTFSTSRNYKVGDPIASVWYLPDNPSVALIGNPKDALRGATLAVIVFGLGTAVGFPMSVAMRIRRGKRYIDRELGRLAFGEDQVNRRSGSASPPKLKRPLLAVGRIKSKP